MSSQHSSFPVHASEEETQERVDHPSTIVSPPVAPPVGHSKNTARFSPFWRDRLCEIALIVSMALYYVIGNPNLPDVLLARINPVFSLPFLLIFAILCWYRLSFALALLSLTLPFYLLQKVVLEHYEFSLAEVALYTCVIVALLRLVILRGDRQNRVSWSALRRRLGPFLLPLLVFLGAAVLSLFIAYSPTLAIRDFRKEIFDPLLYLVCVLFYLRTRTDMLRLLGGLVGTGALIMVLGLIQYFLLRNTLVLESDGVRRVHTVYGSANSIGLLFDYILPVILAWMVARVSWPSRWLAIVLVVGMGIVLYLTHSLGAEVAIAAAAVLVVAFSLRSRKLLLVGVGVALVALAAIALIYHAQIFHLLFAHHMSEEGVSTTTKRLYLWRTALTMIHDSPWLGYGLDNWLCHYSMNNVCSTTLHHYWILRDPASGVPTGLGEEPTLSHPHNIFLHIWVSMGIFALLAFVTVIVLFYRLFVRILRHISAAKGKYKEQWRWITVGVGAALLAALVQGQVDSSFLEQDLAFCFWILVALMILLYTHVREEAQVEGAAPQTGEVR